MEYGKGYQSEYMSFFSELEELGLILFDRKKSLVYPSNLAKLLYSESDIDVKKSGYILLETNYRFYAYTCKKNDNFRLKIGHFGD